MPRPSAVRAQQEPRGATVGYHEDPDVAIVASELIRRHEARFWHLRQFRIGYVMVTDKDPDPAQRETIGKAQKAPPLWAALTGFDAVVSVLERVWNRLDETGREALVAHYLSHLGMSENGSIVLLPHDVEEFAWIAGEYGPWQEDVALFGAALVRHGEKPSAEEKPANVRSITDGKTR